MLHLLVELRMRCLLLKYDSFQWYLKEQVTDYLKGIPPLHNPLKFGFEYPINVMPIKNAERKDGYYVLVPYAVEK